MSSSYYDEDEDESKKPRLKRNKEGFLKQEGLKYEFDCPECNANNPWDDGFAAGAEVQCHYCSTEFLVVAIEDRRIKLKAR